MNSVLMKQMQRYPKKERRHLERGRLFHLLQSCKIPFFCKYVLLMENGKNSQGWKRTRSPTEHMLNYGNN